MKVCSFIPAVTQMIYDMGLEGDLYGVTFECPQVALDEKLRAVRCFIEGSTYSSKEIDQIFSRSKADGKSLYYVDEEVLATIQPDVIFTQDVCEICQIDTACTAAAVANLDKEVQLVTISPQSLDDVFKSAKTIGGVFARPEKAIEYIQKLNDRIQVIIDQQRKYRLLDRRVMLIEWIDPIYNCGHWIPDQIALAGGVDMLSNPAGNSIVTQWDKIIKYDPEILVIAPCGFTHDRTIQEMDILIKKEGWNQLKAVRNGAVYIVDFDLFTQPSAATLITGVEVLAALFHPEVFEIPLHAKDKVSAFSTEKT